MFKVNINDFSDRASRDCLRLILLAVGGELRLTLQLSSIEMGVPTDQLRALSLMLCG